MAYPVQSSEQRQSQRVDADLPVEISIGSQLVLQGKLKDVSLRSAFIILKGSVYFQMNDEVGFTIQCVPGNESKVIHGQARISRIAPGEGIVIYFTRMDDGSTTRLKKLAGA
ncbi:MAG: PilZ domain-containing protein [Candidatus Omnitrophica bacterium]|nr:PilZ domain-containing protein [Candidatus Omnitrophota bacterium]